MVINLMSTTTQALKRRLGNAQTQGNFRSFENIHAGAISVDWAAVHMAALRAAEDSDALRKSFDGDKRKPEVAYELESIWPTSIGRAARLNDAVRRPVNLVGACMMLMTCPPVREHLVLTDPTCCVHMIVCHQ